MRESIGGTLLFWIVLILLSVFIVFIAFVIKYAHVYKAKNSIVNYIERNEGVTSKEEFDNQLLSFGYTSEGDYKICRYLPGSAGGYYYVELYSVTIFPLIGYIYPISITVKGETKTITTGTKIRNTDSSEGNSWFYSPTSECKLCRIGGSCSVVEA